MNSAGCMERFKACLLGVQIGDAFGMPFESMKAEEIEKAMAGKKVSTFFAPVQTKFSSLSSLQPGDTTDDWQLTRANAESFIYCLGYDQLEFAKRHVEELYSCTAGWGGTTKEALLKIEEWFHGGRNGQNPMLPVTECKVGHGGGNGVAMKIAPFGLYYSLHSPDFLRETLLPVVIAHGRMTHKDPRASISAYAVAWLIAKFVSEYFLDADPAALKELISETEAAETIFIREYGVIECDKQDLFSARLKRLTAPGVLNDPVMMAKQVGTGCISVESVCFGIGLFFRHPDDLLAAISEAVHAGGDTDSTASIAGALIGAFAGLRAIPEELANFRLEFRESLYLGEQLFLAAC
jgi:ADP-ribosylglycohydrolase